MILAAVEKQQRVILARCLAAGFRGWEGPLAIMYLRRIAKPQCAELIEALISEGKEQPDARVQP